MTKTADGAVSTYDIKLAKVRSTVEDLQNSGLSLPEADIVVNLIKSAGGVNEAAFAFLTEKDIPLSVNGISIPAPIARMLVAILHEKSAKDPFNLAGNEKPHFISTRQVDRMHFEQLLGYYDPDNDDAVSRKLNELGKGKAFIVFLPEGGIDVETSTKLLKEIRQKFDERPNRIIEIGGSYRPIHKIGENPQQEFAENPFYKGRRLRPDGTCDQLNRSWNGVPQEVRQLVYLAIHITHEANVTPISAAHDLFDRVLSENAFKSISQRCSKAAVLFDEKKSDGSLPTLRLKGGKAGTPNVKNSPFGNQ